MVPLLYSLLKDSILFQKRNDSVTLCFIHLSNIEEQTYNFNFYWHLSPKRNLLLFFLRKLLEPIKFSHRLIIIFINSFLVAGTTSPILWLSKGMSKTISMFYFKPQRKMTIVPEHVVPVIFHKVNFVEWYTQCVTHKLCIFTILICRTDSRLIQLIPVPHVQTGDLVPWLENSKGFKGHQNCTATY